MKFQLRIFLGICCLHLAIFFSPLHRGAWNEAFAQSYPDAGSWNTLNVEYGLNTRFTALFTQECRIKENFSRLNLFYTNIGLEYKMLRNFKTAFIYRFINKYQDDNTFSFRHRLMLDLMYKTKFGKLAVSYRQRLQVEERDIYSSKNGKTQEWYSRNKFSLKYDIDKPLTPYVAVELRYQIHDLRNTESDQTWHRSRYSLGIDYKRNDRSVFGIYYLIQHEFNIPFPEDQYIVGLEYALTL